MLILYPIIGAGLLLGAYLLWPHGLSPAQIIDAYVIDTLRGIVSMALAAVGALVFITSVVRLMRTGAAVWVFRGNRAKTRQANRREADRREAERRAAERRVYVDITGEPIENLSPEERRRQMEQTFFKLGHPDRREVERRVDERRIEERRREEGDGDAH